MKSTLILLLIATTFSLTAQHSYIPSERTFTTKDGLSSDKIHALHKGSQGFIWIGTENGLDRFDGQTFVHFNKNAYPEMTLDRVQNIVEDKDGYLWLIEENEPFEQSYHSPEINLYNIHTGKWTTLKERFGKDLPFQVKDVKYIEQLSDGSIFIFIEQQRKGYLYQNKGNFKSIPLPIDLLLISDCAIQKDGNLLLEGLEKLDKEDRYIYNISQKGKLINKYKTDFPIQIQSASQSYELTLRGNYYLAGGKNLDAYQLHYPNFQQIKTASSNAQTVDQTAWNNDEELLWIKNSSNLFVAKSNGDIVYQKDDKFDNNTIPILFDGTTTWYSNRQNGLIALTLQPNHFQTYQYYKEEFKNSSRGIYADKSGEIWLSTISGILHQSTNNEPLRYKEDISIFTDFIKAKDGSMWYLKGDGLAQYDFITKKEQFFSFNQPSINVSFWSLYEANNGQFWFFGNTGFHYAFDPNTKKITTIAQHPTELGPEFNVYDVQKRDAQSVWLCTNQGLYILDNQGKYIAHYNQHQKGKFHLPTNDIHHIYQDKNSSIWLATGDAGLIQLKIKNEELRIENHFTIKDGLSCNILHAIYEDDFGYLWISSNEGLMQFDKQTEKVVAYTTENGLLHNEFNRIAHFQAENGMLYFGGVTGMMSFHPKHFSQVRHEGSKAPLVITDFQQFSAKNEQFKNLTNELNQTKTIRLEPNDRFFNLTLSMLNYQDNATFQYRIKDLYDWQTAKGNELNISGLPYGKHTLEIKAQNDNQQEAANMLTYDIVVLRPFYLQWWFLILVLSALGSAAFYFIRWRTQQMMVLQETEQLRQLDKMKSQFFANISHELRTPLTLILAPLSQLLQQNDLQKKYKSQIALVHQNGKKLLTLVNEVLDLSKLEVGKLALHCTPTKIPHFIERIVANFESAAKIKNIEYQFMTFLQKDIVAEFDQDKLEKILNNLLSNALKFTPKNGTIQIIVGQMGQDLIIKVKDSGNGILKEDLPFIFDRYFQSKNKQMSGGTGIGLALTKELVELMNGEISVQSTINEGTEFEIKLPIVETLHRNVSAQNRKEPLITINPNNHQNLQEFKPTKTSTKKDTILLVEDNPSLQQFIQSILTPHYNVIVTGNGVEALEKLRITNYELEIEKDKIIPNLILSDVMMPEMDGFTLLEKVKSDDNFCSIPFILLTARADMKDKLKGLRIGVDDYMTKPFEVEELLLRIKNLIANAKSRGVELKEERNKIKLAVKSTNQPITNHQSPVTTQDLDWLAKVEVIAKREVRNSKYTVEDLAYEMHMSRSQLYRKLKQTAGLTPNRYFRNVKLHQAKYILENEEVHTLTEIAYAVGFENITHFVKLYETAFGKRPHDYLKKQGV